MYDGRQVVSGVSLHSGLADNVQRIFGVSRDFDSSRVPDVDDRLGYRKGQPWAVQTNRIPRIQLVTRFTPANPEVTFKQIELVTAISVAKIHVTGLDPAQGPIALCFDNANGFRGDMHYITTSSTVLAGMNYVPTNSIVIEKEPTATTASIVPGEELYFAQYMKPRKLENATCRVMDLSGNPVAYTEVLIWFLIQTEYWQ